MAKTIQKITETNYIILDDSEKWIKELYQEADRKTAEKFGKNSLAYKTIKNGIDIQNITGSQFFWNTNLNKYSPKNQKVILLKDMEEINDLDENFFKGFYTDSTQVGLRTQIPSYEKNMYILKTLVKQIKGIKIHGGCYDFSSENPLIISDLELIQDNNSRNQYGLLLRIGKDTKLENDLRFAYSNNQKQISFGEKLKTIYTKENGLSGVYLGWFGGLVSRYDDLAFSEGFGRVVLKDAEGVASKNLKEYKSRIKENINEKILKLKILEKEINKI